MALPDYLKGDQPPVRIHIPETAKVHLDGDPRPTSLHGNAEVAAYRAYSASQVVGYWFEYHGKPAWVQAKHATLLHDGTVENATGAEPASSLEDALDQTARLSWSAEVQTAQTLLDAAQARLHHAASDWEYAARNLELLAKEVEDTAHSLRLKLQRALSGARPPRGAVNELGELQSRGPLLDAKCARVETLAAVREKAEEDVSRLQTALRMAVRNQVNPTSPKA